MSEVEAKSITRVDLHCHSLLSDGALPPRAIAETLAEAGVQVASLTDHDTVEGLAEFSVFLARRDIAFVPGVELTTQLDGVEVHLLGYGFDPQHPELLERLRTLRGAKPRDVQNVQDSIRVSLSGAPISTHDAIALVHRAGGRAFLAHPLYLESDIKKLESIVMRLKASGLDGIEALYAGFPTEDQAALVELAKRQDLLVSGGTDLHAVRAGDPVSAGVEMPSDLWREFRDAVCLPAAGSVQEERQVARPQSRPHWRAFGLQIVMPSVLTLALFIAALFFVFVPRFEASLLERKREMIRELTNSAWSILDGFHRDAEAGKMSQAEAQKMAIARIETLRYGRDAKDYFWIQDTQPRMIMHPYRPDLNGQDVSDFRDARGVAIFSEFAKVALQSQGGYVDYVWQWKDDPNRLASKESYIRTFQPWGWVIGTGIYVEDVQEEIRGIERSLLVGAGGICLAVALLLLYVIRGSMTLEQERAEAEKGLLESRERYRSLVEATTEGTLLVTEGRCRYANPIFLESAGSSLEELGLLELDDFFPPLPGNKDAWVHLSRLLDGKGESEGFDAILRKRSGELADCIVSASRISFAERSGFILLVRQVSPPVGTSWDGLDLLAEKLFVGLFRARPSRRGSLTQISRAARQMLFPLEQEDHPVGSLGDAFPTLYESMHDDLLARGSSLRLVEVAGRWLKIQAVLERDEHGLPRQVDGMVWDVTDEEGRRKAQALALERVQRSLLFLHEPILQHLEPSVQAAMDSSVATVAALMSQKKSSIAVVQSPTGRPVGIITDEDFRQRVAAAGMNAKMTAAEIMSSPVVSIPETAPVYEALLIMERRGLHHLVAVDSDGALKGVVRSSELAPFKEYGPLVLARDLSMADSPSDMADHSRRIPSLVQALLDGGAGASQVSALISTAWDSASSRLIELAQEQLGPPPCAFAWMALGSQGRQEMSLTSDQDNAIVFAEETQEAEVYFAKMAALVNGGLEECGLHSCPGGVMAKNPSWRLSLSQWKEKFTEWIALPEPQPLLEFTIIFDFRLVFGDAALVQTLREHVWKAAAARPGFFPLFAQSALQFRPPARLFGRVVSFDHQGRLDLKDAMIPLAAFARLYALKERSSAAGTAARFEELVRLSVIRPHTGAEAIQAYEDLQVMKLRSQVTAAMTGQALTNEVALASLGPEEVEKVQSALNQLSLLQARISQDFLGGASL